VSKFARKSDESKEQAARNTTGMLVARLPTCVRRRPRCNYYIMTPQNGQGHQLVCRMSIGEHGTERSSPLATKLDDSYWPGKEANRVNMQRHVGTLLLGPTIASHSSSRCCNRMPTYVSTVPERNTNVCLSFAKCKCGANLHYRVAHVQCLK
jgi:hypothetical protein